MLYINLFFNGWLGTVCLEEKYTITSIVSINMSYLEMFGW